MSWHIRTFVVIAFLAPLHRLALDEPRRLEKAQRAAERHVRHARLVGQVALRPLDRVLALGDQARPREQHLLLRRIRAAPPVNPANRR